MNCKDYQENMPAFLEGDLDSDQQQAYQSHLQSCTDCQKVHDETKELLGIISQSPGKEPPLHQRPQFLANLQVEKNRLKDDRVRTITMPVGIYRVAASVTLLVIGFTGGWLVNRNGDDNSELLALQTEVQSMKQMVMMSMLTETSASERIQAVSLVKQFDEPSLEMVETLFRTLNEDDSPNVRLAALRALEKFASDEDIRLMLIRSFEFQTDPVVQISLINLMVELEDKRAAKKFQQLIDDEEVTGIVKDQAKIGIQLLI